MDGRRREPDADAEDVGDGDAEAGADELAWKDFFGSSVSLAPSLLSIFDRQVAASSSERDSPEQRDLSPANCQDEDIDHRADPRRSAFDDRPSPESSAVAADAAAAASAPGNELVGFTDVGGSGAGSGGDRLNARMLSSLCVGRTDANPDPKKRPLSIRSTSSNSSSSLSLQPHQRKKVARDGLPERTTGVPPPLSVFCDSCELPATGEGLRKVNVEAHPRDAMICQSRSPETEWCSNRLEFSDLNSQDSLSLMQNNGDYSCMEVELEHGWSPTAAAGDGTLEMRHQYLCRTESASYTDRVVREIVETERAYVRDLQDIVQGYIEHVRASPGLLSRADADTLFGNIEDVYKFHSEFLQQLEKSGTDPTRIAECFVQRSNGFTIYSDYCTNYPRSVGVLTRCMRDRRISDVLKRQQMSLQHGLPLGSYLLKPVQRILKYHLLLQNLLNNCDRNGSSYETISQAFGSMMSVAQRINDMKRVHEQSVRTQEMQSLLYEWNGVDPNTYGDLVLEDQFQMFGAKAFRLVWVFRKAVVIAKKKEDETIQIKAAIMFSNLMLVETIQRAPMNFHLIPFDNPKVQYTVQARTMEQKRHWCQEIKKLILENYEAVIPEKARQLVMIMGKEEEPYISNGTETPLEPTKHAGNGDRRKSRQRSSGFIPDLGILKLKKGTKVDSSGMATPDSDASWKNGGTDFLNHSLDQRDATESFSKGTAHKPNALHTSFSLQNIRSPVGMAPLHRIGGSEGDWHELQSHSNHRHTRKLLTAESLKEEFCESDSYVDSSQNSTVRSRDWSSRSAWKDATQTPVISEETDFVDNKHRSLFMPESSAASVRLFQAKQNGQSDEQLSSNHDLVAGKSAKNHGAITVGRKEYHCDRSLPDCLNQTSQSDLYDLKAVSSPLVSEDRFCSSDSIVKNSEVQKSFGNVFVDRTAFFVSDSAGCMGNNRMLDRRLARLCTPPRELGNPNLVQDVRLSKERGKTVVHYGTPLRTVEFPEDICETMKNGGSNFGNELTESLYRLETSSRDFCRDKTNDCRVFDGHAEIYRGQPRRSTSVQEDMSNNCVSNHSGNSTQPKPKRSGSFHGNSLYSTADLGSTKRVISEQKSPVNSLRNTFLSWTVNKFTRHRSRSTENCPEPVVALSSPTDGSAEKPKLKPSLIVSRLARASYRKLKREKATETLETVSPESSVTKQMVVADVVNYDKEPCPSMQHMKLLGTHILSSYALTSLPKQTQGSNGTAVQIQTKGQVETLAREPYVIRPRSCHAYGRGRTGDNAVQEGRCDSVVYQLRYIDEDTATLISGQNEEPIANNNDYPEEVPALSPMKTKACSAISLPGMRNGFVWSSSLYTINQEDGSNQNSVGTEGHLTCFSAPRGHWIPYIDDSGSED